MKTIPINVARMTNEVHAQFHESVLALLERSTPDEIKSLCVMYRQAFDSEADALLIITKSELTAQISEQDRVRDSIFRGFSDTVKGYRNHFDFDVRQAANLLWNVFLHYGNIAQKTLDAQTAATNDMLREFERADLKQAIDKLQVNDWKVKMEEENQKFHQLMMQRYDETANQTANRMKKARPETDKVYRAIATQIDNLMLINPSNAPMNELLNQWNAIVKRFKSILAQQLSRKKQ